MFPAPGAAPAPPVLTTPEAEKALGDAFNEWKQGTVPVKNAPANCPRIYQHTWDHIRRNWPTPFNPNYRGGGVNAINQSSAAVLFNKQDVKKWVTVSVSGTQGTHDLHALWKGNSYAGFLFHFRVV